MPELTKKSSQSEKQKSEGSSQDSETTRQDHRFVDLNDRAEAFRLGAQLAAALSGTNAEQIASQPSEETSESPMTGDLLLEDLMETYPEVSRETLDA